MPDFPIDGSCRVEDQWTPRERGLLAGKDWGRMSQATEDELHAVARGGPIPADVEQLVEETLGDRLNASVESDARASFWRGFRHGVAAYLVSLEIGQQN